MVSRSLRARQELLEGNHLFFYQVPERAKYMEDVVAKLPAEFKAVEIS